MIFQRIKLIESSLRFFAYLFQKKKKRNIIRLSQNYFLYLLKQLEVYPSAKNYLREDGVVVEGDERLVEGRKPSSVY